jgi:hypothetical protein
MHSMITTQQHSHSANGKFTWFYLHDDVILVSFVRGETGSKAGASWSAFSAARSYELGKGLCICCCIVKEWNDGGNWGTTSVLWPWERPVFQLLLCPRVSAATVWHEAPSGELGIVWNGDMWFISLFRKFMLVTTIVVLCKNISDCLLWGMLEH